MDDVDTLGTMLIYGGYRDLRGTCTDLWAFHLWCENPLVPEHNYHPALLVSYVKSPKIKPTPTLSKQYDYDYKNANFAKLYKALSDCDWMQSSPILNISGHLQIENRTKSDIPSSMNFNDAVIEGSDNIANAFAEYFESVYGEDNPSDMEKSSGSFNFPVIRAIKKT
ncbi:hypothetical protein CBL_12299 [Carabus blaptoides fortunei]